MPNTTRNKKTPYRLYVKLYGRSVALDEMCCKESRLLHRLYKSKYHGDEIFNIKDNVLEKALDFCKQRAQIINHNDDDDDDQNLQDKLNEFDSEFLQWIKTTHDDYAIVDLMDAACKLEIDSLLDLLLDDVVEMITQKAPQEIEEIFIVRYNGDDRTFDAIKYIMGVARWVLK